MQTHEKCRRNSCFCGNFMAQWHLAATAVVPTGRTNKLTIQINYYYHEKKTTIFVVRTAD